MIEFFIAKKHIFERKRQSVVAMFGVAIGIIVLVVSLGISNGLDRSMMESIFSMTSHIIVTKNGKSIENYREFQSKVEKIRGVKGVVPQSSEQGILKYNQIHGSYVTGVKINGLDFDDAKKTMDLDEKVIYGTMDAKTPTEFIIGKKLFDDLGAELGDEVTIVTPKNIQITLTIIGVYQSGYEEYDKTIIIVPLRVVQILTYGGDSVTDLEVFLDDIYSADKTALQIREETGLSTSTWKDLNRNLLASLSLQKSGMIMVFSLIVIIAGFLIWVILSMSVKEKIKDIGIMRSMGFSSKNIMRIFIIEGLFLGVAGIVIGLMISGVILWYLKNYNINEITSIYNLNKIPVEIKFKEVLLIIGANVIIVFLSSIFPAYRGAKLEVVEALNHD
ncbi:ABC transporter permease [Psychrilyobacter atlanticus]|uniref:ABC transporter permease n=1 Tax=Psychrilyobacter atlanticus TaxID=271091 RepID=UPI00041E6A41|nr:ABC transporter permease [Psychrilyobacter atlanticus]